MPDPEAHSGWGLHDADVSRIVRKQIAALANETEPFAVAWSTIDSHHALGGTSSCGRTPFFGSTRYRVECADRVVSAFITDIRARWPETIVVLMSDHLAHEPHAVLDDVRDQTARRLRFAVWGPKTTPRAIARPGTHMDIAPTVLDVMGLHAYRRLIVGASLLSFDSPWLSHPNAETLRSAPPMLEVAIAPGKQITFKRTGPVVQIDGVQTLANHKGYVLDDAVFTMRFHDNGEFDSTLRWQSFEELTEINAGAMVIGLATNDAFKRAIGAPDTDAPVWFAGRVGSAQGLMTGVTNEHAGVTLPAAMFEQVP